ncbi:cupin domain-containing protein [Alteromonadaceae bacterium BrNp21-10]|nr:cupin domain-containing protein [Alteromonadaceae bacterium BrNp21-10]
MRFITFIALILTSVITHAGQTLSSAALSWPQANSTQNADSWQQKLLTGSGKDIQKLHLTAQSLAAHSSFDNLKNTSGETLLIVKSGTLSIKLNSQLQQVSDGSVMVFNKTDKVQLANTTAQPVTYYLFEYAQKPNATAHNAFVINWNDVKFNASDIGGRRDFFNQPTSAFDSFEMHVSTLNEGLTNHALHTHGAEEFVVMMKGEVVMQIGDKNVSAKAGDVVFLESMVPHSLNNTGAGETQYFAFQFWNKAP